jgi:hypothetical protein
MQGGQTLTFHQVLNLWATNPTFRKFYGQTLIEHGDDGCLWEHPRLTRTSAEQLYECVITRTENFGRFSATPKPFHAKMEADARISVFPNLGGDAVLIIPNEPPANSVVNCRDLVSFCRTAPEDWLHEFWQTVGREALVALTMNSSRQYLSTHGFGVLWLHVRLEERGKYYRYAKYR